MAQRLLAHRQAIDLLVVIEPPSGQTPNWQDRSQQAATRSLLDVHGNVCAYTTCRLMDDPVPVNFFLKQSMRSFLKFTDECTSVAYGSNCGLPKQKRQNQPGGIERNLHAYRILAEDDLSSYDNLIIETRRGHLIRKYKQDYPVQCKSYNDGNGNALLILGFLDSVAGWLSAEQIEHSEGEFVAVLSEDSGAVHIINDRFGSRPFYLINNQDGIYFSSNLDFLLQLIGGSHEADILGWFHMFSYGHTFGSRTTFKNVNRLLPGSHVVISPDGGLEERRYWRLEYAPASGLDPVSYSKEVFEAFKEGATLRSRLVGKGVIALSGGLDSRLVAAALPDDVKFSAFTFLNSGEGVSTPDTEVAAQVCSALGLEHRVEHIPTEEFSSVAENVDSANRRNETTSPLRNCDAIY